MAGITLTIGADARVFNATFDDTQVSGGGGSSMNIDGDVHHCTFNMPTADLDLDGELVDCQLTAADVDMDGGVINCRANVSTVELSGHQSRIRGGDIALSPGSGENEGILVSADDCAIQAAEITCVNPNANNTHMAISVTGDRGLFEGLRFTRTGTDTWAYLIEVQSGATGNVIGTYTYLPAVAATGTVDDSGTGTVQVI